MKINLKEQIVYLSLNQISFKECWIYLNAWLQDGQGSDPYPLEVCQEIAMKLASQPGLAFLRRINFHQADLKEDQIRALANQAVMAGEPSYPKLWLELPQPPLLVYCRGHRQLLQEPAISIVGTRKITKYGEEVARNLTKAVVRKGWKVVSGLATGVDHVVHQTAMKEGRGTTIAIIPTGLDQYYPYQHMTMQEDLGRDHLLVSEFLPAVKAAKSHFIMRNRLVAGMTPITVVIEAAQQSGSLITANYALQFNREVYAVPGRINDSQSRGCNNLIEQGARPILGVDEAVYEMEELLLAHGILASKPINT